MKVYAIEFIRPVEGPGEPEVLDTMSIEESGQKRVIEHAKHLLAGRGAGIGATRVRVRENGPRGKIIWDGN